MNKFQESQRILRQLKRAKQHYSDVENTLKELYQDLKVEAALYVEISKKMKNSEHPSLYEGNLSMCKEAIININRTIRINKRYMETMRTFIQTFKHMDAIGA